MDGDENSYTYDDGDDDCGDVVDHDDDDKVGR